MGIAPDLSSNSATQERPLGDLFIDEKGRHYRYVSSHAGCTAGKFYILPDDGTYHVIAMTTSNVGTPGTNWKSIGVACADITTDYYGWVFTGYGEFECIIENSFAPADVIYTTATGGVPGTNSSSHILDGFKTIDAGVTDTRVTCFAAGKLTAGLVACCD